MIWFLLDKDACDFLLRLPARTHTHTYAHTDRSAHSLNYWEHPSCARWSGLHPCRGLCSTILLLTLKTTHSHYEKKAVYCRFSLYLLTLEAHPEYLNPLAKIRWSIRWVNLYMLFIYILSQCSYFHTPEMSVQFEGCNCKN